MLQEAEETQVRFPGWEDPLEMGMATHSTILVWRISWTEEPGGLQFTGSQRIGYYRSDSPALDQGLGSSEGGGEVKPYLDSTLDMHMLYFGNIFQVMSMFESFN